ncbi:MAG TPA: isoprenyl transferase [Acidobacteriota bacterium]|nr:isoprenyl transferase [Acidobacteriota bacterium]
MATKLTETDRLAAEIGCYPDRIPAHVAIIMDGNGRWAALRNKPRTFGHEMGVRAVKEVVRASSQIGVKFLTLYTFSVENWKRPKDEVAALMKLLCQTTVSELQELLDNDVKLITTGRINGLSQDERDIIQEAVRETSHNGGLVLNLALNYGGRTEILDAVRAIAYGVKAGAVDPQTIDEGLFSSFLYTAELPDPDLLIRTSGELRISNFLLWQTSYTELHIIDTLWPDFGRKELFEAIRDYQRRERRFGTVTEDGTVPGAGS